MKCPICKDYHGVSEKCAPEFLVVDETYTGEDGMMVRGWTHEDAARAYAKHYNEHSDYALMDDSVDVAVTKDGVTKYFTVSAEPDVHYSSQENIKS